MLPISVAYYNTATGGLLLCVVAGAWIPLNHSGNFRREQALSPAEPGSPFGRTTRKASIERFIAFAMMTVTAAAKLDSGKVRVWVYDLTYLSPAALAAAEREAAGVFAAAGIEIRWTWGSPSAPEAHDVDFSGQG